MKTPVSCRVLYAEINKEACFMLGTYLGFSSIDVCFVHTIEDAVQKARAEHFDLYLLGSHFLDGSGSELCHQLRDLTPQTPIVFYSGNAYALDKLNGLAAGANAYLVKPEIDTVAATILGLCGQTAMSVSQSL
jgi:DNA-binding response OmpR family regulator